MDNTIIKTQQIQIKKQELAIQILTTVVDQLRQPFNNSSKHEDLYWLATNALNQLDEMGMLPEK